MYTNFLAKEFKYLIHKEHFQPKKDCDTFNAILVWSYPCGPYWRSVWPDFSAGLSEASAPSHCWCLTDPAGWAASSLALSPHHSAQMTTGREEQRSHDFSSVDCVKNLIPNKLNQTISSFWNMNTHA